MPCGLRLLAALGIWLAAGAAFTSSGTRTLRRHAASLAQQRYEIQPYRRETRAPTPNKTNG
jgi:hypothetical protein